MGDEHYNNNFKNYDDVMKSMTDYILAAKSLIRTKKSSVSEREALLQIQKENFELTTTKNRLYAEEEYCRNRISKEIGAMLEQDSEFVEDLDQFLVTSQSLLSEYSEIFVRIRLLGQNFEQEFDGQHTKITNYITDFIKNTRKRKELIKMQSVRKEEQNKLRLQNETRNRVLHEKHTLCQNIFDNVCLRIKKLEARCVKVSELSDTQVLDVQKKIHDLDTDFNDILDRVTKIYEVRSTDCEKTDELIVEINEKVDKLLVAIEFFKSDLASAIVTRDISPEKLKNASLLGIKLDPYKGYESSIDIYTFKSEFEKLIAPHVHAPLLPDHLKKSYLQGQAFELVKEINDLDLIWDRLKQSYGNVENLMNMKLGEFDRSTPLAKVSGDVKIVQAITKIKNIMTDLSTLAEKHHIEPNLYHSSNISRILGGFGRKRQTDLTKKFVQNDLSDKDKWAEMIRYLEDELKIKEHLILLDKSNDQQTAKGKSDKSPEQKVLMSQPSENKCFICNRTDHVPYVTRNGKSIINYVSCKKFVDMSPKDRFNFLKQKKFCAQCLTPGIKSNHQGRCFDKYKCQHESHNEYPRGLHVLVCESHKDDEQNKQLFQTYKEKCILNNTDVYPEYSTGMTLHVEDMTYAVTPQPLNDEDNDRDVRGMYMLQTVVVQGRHTNLFFDNGCGDIVVKKTLADFLQKHGRAACTEPGPKTLSGVGDIKSVCPHGRFDVAIPTFDGSEANMDGICLDKITSKFPTIPLETVEKDIQEGFAAAGGDISYLPKLPKSVGGETELMIGVKFLKYFPKFRAMLPCGLSIYESVFLNPDGSRGVVAGPHRIVAEIYRKVGCNYASLAAFFSEQSISYRNSLRVDRDTMLLGYGDSTVHYKNENEYHDRSEIEGFDEVQEPYSFFGSECGESIEPTVYIKKRQLKCVKNFESVENSGTEASYRCPKCRGCAQCKKSALVENISIKEEVEQGLIDSCVTVNLDESYTESKLPFICDPVTKLTSNRHIAEKVYQGQIRKLSKSPKDKNDVIEAFNKLIELGFFVKYDDLAENEKVMIDKSPIKYFIPWRPVWNENSVSTACRPVFDASFPTDTECLNNTLAKGKNNMNHLIEIFLRWRVQVCGFHTDIRKMYNSVRLALEHWCYQLCLFHPDLDPEMIPIVYVIRTLIYGVKPSGNLAERALRETARLNKNDYPRQNEIVQDDIYVDDCISGESSEELAFESASDLEKVLNTAGFRLKGITFSGHDPPDHLSNDANDDIDKSINVSGMKWYSREDFLSLKIGDQRFGKKVRGKRPPEKYFKTDGFSRTDCAARVGEIFDLPGRFAPLTAGFKLDLRDIKDLNWDDNVPIEKVPKWRENFDMIKKLGEIKFKRCVVPEDAISLDIDTIEVGDSSLEMSCSAIYVRFKRKNGLYSCQLIFGRTKIISDMTIPRGELFASVLTATTGHLVCLSLKKYLKSRVCLTDSQIALYWINNTTSPLKSWVRNRVIEINRLTNREDWYHIDSKNNTADIGTRRGVTFSDISDDSPWFNGHDWAHHEKEQFPMKSVEEIKLSQSEVKANQDETVKMDLSDTSWIDRQLNDAFHLSSYLSRDDKMSLADNVRGCICERYRYSQYVIDPNKFRFRKVVRILALVLMFVRKLKSKIKKNHLVFISNDELPSQFSFRNDQYLITEGICSFPFNCPKGLVVVLGKEFVIRALEYFYKKASKEIMEFCGKNAYEKISEEKFGILYYTGRILPSQKFTNKIDLSDACIDLSTSSFCVPLVDKYSPIAYSIINEIHWYHDDAKHSGDDTVFRYVQQIAHIFDGRSLVTAIRHDCARCRFLRKRAIDVAMGPKSDYNFCIAPPFYVTQVDMFGPFSSYSYANKRATIKVWFVIFVCCTTGAVDVRVTEDYTTEAFLFGFIRFSCKVGYPRKLLPDAGSQLVKGCSSMIITFTDVRTKLHKFGVDYEVCPVGAHYMHGKVERKIQHVKQYFSTNLNDQRLSVIQWETLGQQISNSINNLPIATRYVTKDIDNLDLLTPNRLLLARNNDRCPVGQLIVSEDVSKLVNHHNDVYEAWFRTWLVSYVPSLMFQPKWYKSDSHPKVGDVVLFLKSEKEFDKQYQYGVITDLKVSRDGKIRQVEVEYQNFTENVKRKTTRGTREIVVIHPIDELGLTRELNELFEQNVSSD